MSQRREPRGITGKQAKYLASLQRAAGERYTGGGLSAYEAGLEIDRLLGKPNRYRVRPQPRAAAYGGNDIIRAPKRKARKVAARQAAVEAAERNAVPSRAGREAPTDVQIHDLAALARRAGETTPRPSRRGDAAREIARLRSASP